MRPTIFQKTEYRGGLNRRVRGVAESEAEQTGPTQVVRSVPGGVQMNMEKMYGSGLGTVTVQLNSLVPTSEIFSTTSTQGTMVIQFDLLMSFTLSGRAKDAIAPPGTARGPDKWVDLKALRGINVVNLGGTAYQPRRPPFASATRAHRTQLASTSRWAGFCGRLPKGWRQAASRPRRDAKSA